MPKNFRLLFFVLTSTALLRAQSTPPPAPPNDDTVHLDAFVVTAGGNGQTAFDLAQGTSILTGAELARRTQPSLGETLSATPGVTSTYFGPGASRPVIRGLGGDRIRVLANGVGSLDASNVSPDHTTALEPLFASRIEVLRGPSTLLYGSSAVGGVVNVIDNAIPSVAGDGTAHGAFEVRGLGAADERAALASIESGTATFALHVNALRRRTGDVAIPGVARIDAAAPPDQPTGTLPNSATDTQSGSVGGTAFWSAGHLGAALTQYQTIYGVPTGEDPPVSINLKQTRFDLDGEITEPFGIFRSATARFGYARYRHSELDGSDIGTTFHNRAWEGRLELPHVALGDFSGTVGVQSSFSDFSATGEEVVTPPSRTGTAALFALEEWKRPRLTLQLGARYERQSITLGEVAPGLPSPPGYTATSGEKKSLGGVSASSGVVVYPAENYSVGLSLAYSERLPTVQELFSNGPHGGTAAYEVGTSTLGVERSLGADLSVRKRAGFVTGSLGAFVNRFRDYVYEEPLASNAIPAVNNPDALTPYQFVAADALFYGGEAELTFHLVDRPGRRFHTTLLGDYVHAQQTTADTPLPRLPPLRYGVRFDLGDEHWDASAEIRHNLRQNRVSPGETPTAAATLLNANLAYTLPVGRCTYAFFLRADNLANAEVRVSTSFLKDLAPLPGRSLTLGVRTSF
ncbi:TonB-dependent receptor [Horticoccus luteus]|uniref:TonB-dependent receptor n=1 Tax=Horticoccus luteus TaxID=2862869 RepID=A0A8F9TV04_9BACT|nr:TonB-dependent receptor [Horticoccus luteus]QYM78274.1 TonB-dependent receptor [Horticoccus luteus]